MATASVTIDNTREDPGVRAPLITGGHDYASVTDMVCTIAERPKPPLAWYVAFGVSLSLMGMFFVLIGYQYFSWLRHLRDEWKDPFSITAVFTYGIIFVTGISFGLYAWNVSPFLAFKAIGYEVIGIGIILILFYREIPETIN